MRPSPLFTLMARILLGVVFIYLGWNKALDPVGFLKLVRQYQIVDNYFLLNITAMVLPWFEILCGLLMISGIALRGTALVLLLMLGGFTGLIVNQAWGIHHVSHIAFCAVRFDCGCGTGEVFACWKVMENLSLAFLATAVLAAPGRG